jgi:hypothetical protein
MLDIVTSNQITYTQPKNFILYFQTENRTKVSSMKLQYSNNYLVYKNLELLGSFLSFETNWNDLSAQKFQESLINFCKRIVVALQNRQLEIYPTGRNSIQMEYEKDDSSYLEFEVFNESKIDMLEVRNSEKIKEATLTKIDEIVNCVNLFFG